MMSTRINPRVVWPALSSALRAELRPQRVLIALKRLTGAEAALIGSDAPGDASLDLAVDEVQAICSRARAAGMGEFADAVGQVVANCVRDEFVVPLPRCELRLGQRTLLMGVVNVTPDSFSDGGMFFDHSRAIEHALRLADEGADILDIGGESTRPGAEPVPLEEEFSRVLPVIEAVTKQVSIPVSIDTYKAAVAQRAVAAGAQIINDISALRADPEMAATAARAATGLVLMHIQGTPRDMQQNPHYDDLMDEICSYLRESLAIARRGGVSLEKTIIDPGIGFGKTVWHNLEVLDRLGELRSIGRPILIGTSRKSTIGKVTGAPVGERQFGTAATVAVSIRNGAHIVRVHDVGQMRQVAKMTDAIGRWQQAVPAGEMR